MGYFRQNVKINVIYKNGVKDHISPALLGTLINSKQIEKFERSNGWVHLGVDPVRCVKEADFTGIERRDN